MKERLLTNWTFTRVLYLLMGVAIIIQSVMIQQWFGVLFGGYFASMGLFSYGCAGGRCFGSSCAVEIKQKTTVQDIEYEEIKTK